MSSKNLPTLLKEIEAAVTWAKNSGVNIPESNTWIRKSANKIKRIISHTTKNDQAKQFTELYDNPADAQENVSDLIHLQFIHQYIGDQDNKILVDKLSLAMTGADNIRSETSANTKARDARFELYVCACLNERGFQAQLCEPNPDIQARRFKKTSAAIECKRIFSKAGFEKRVLEAAKQLKKRPGNAAADLHIAFIDVTRAITDGKLHLHGSDRQAVIDDLVVELNKWGEQTMNMLRRRRVVGVDAVVLVYQHYIESPTEVGEYSLTGITQQLAVINPNNLRKQRRLTERFTQKFSAKSKLFINIYR